VNLDHDATNLPGAGATGVPGTDGPGAGEGAGGSGGPSVAGIRGMRLAELRAECRKRGLDPLGRKHELARRLEDAVHGN